MSRTLRVIASCLFLACLLLTVGCETVKGFGKDVSNMGQGIQGK
jgi:predicted small secreted protein